MTVTQQTAEASSATSHASAGLGSTLFRVAWLAILLGFAMEILLLLFTAGFEILPGFRSVLADLIGKVSWSALVCAGLAIGTAASKVRAPFMGLLGLLAAPIAFHVSRTLQQGMAKTLEVAAAGAPVGTYTLILLALLKAVEYGCLGAAIGWIGRRPWGGALAHAAVGVCRGDTLWRRDRKLHVLDGSRAPGSNRPLLPRCERDPLPRGLLIGSLLRDGFGGASRAMKPMAALALYSRYSWETRLSTPCAPSM
jgi:hypothetical protein